MISMIDLINENENYCNEYIVENYDDIQEFARSRGCSIISDT